MPQIVASAKTLCSYMASNMPNECGVSSSSSISVLGRFPG